MGDRLGWIVAVVALLLTIGVNVAGWGSDSGGREERIKALEKRVSEFNLISVNRGDLLATHTTRLSEVDRRLIALEQQIQAVTLINARLARIEVVVELIGQRLGATHTRPTTP